MSELLTDVHVQAKAVEIVRTFAVSAPVTDPELFAGRRTPHLISLLVAVAERGRHVIVYGRRGVGKTSLVNMIAPSLGDQVHVVVHNCREETSLEPLLRDAATAAPKTVIVLDDVHRVRNGEAPTALAEMIRALANSDTTLVVVGSADSPDSLVAGSASLDPRVIALRLPRMTPEEMREIVDNRIRRLSMTIDDGAKALIAALSHGQPYHAHLLSLKAAEDAVVRGRATHVDRDHVLAGMKRAIDEAPREMTAAWQAATRSPRVNLFAEVLLACALVPKHELGWFTSTGLTEPLREITGKKYTVNRFSQHLQEFSETRGPILQRAGTFHEYFYRFVNPLMESFAVMKAAAAGLWNPEHTLAG